MSKKKELSDDDDMIEEDEEGFDEEGEDEPNYDDDEMFAEADDVMEDDDGAFNSMVAVPKEKDFLIMKKKELQDFQEKVLNEVAPNLGLGKADTALLLQNFKWDAEKLLQIYFDNSAKYLDEAGLLPEDKKPKPIDPTKPATCTVCFETVKGSDICALACGHPFCKDCWKGYLGHKAQNTTAQGMLNTTCMWRGCKLKVNKECWERWSDPKDYEKYCYFYLKNFVESDKKFSFCPNPKCDRAVRYNGVGRPFREVKCECTQRFCFACCLESHNPVTCKQLEGWKQRNEDDAESLKLISATTKRCFHCGMATIRNEGCNHMTCRKESGGCGGEWCWMCRGDWKSHGEHTGGFYSCNKYDVSDGKKADDEASVLKARADLFKHYFDRFFGHDLGKRAAQKKKEQIQTLCSAYRTATGRDPRFLEEAVDALVEARHMLKYTYVYAYYMDELKQTQNKLLFDYQQANAEGITERLADMIFNVPTEKIDADKVKSMTSVTQKYLHNLIDSFKELETPEVKKDPKSEKTDSKVDLKKSGGLKKTDKKSKKK